MNKLETCFLRVVMMLTLRQRLLVVNSTITLAQFLHIEISEKVTGETIWMKIIRNDLLMVPGCVSWWITTTFLGYTPGTCLRKPDELLVGHLIADALVAGFRRPEQTGEEAPYFIRSLFSKDAFSRAPQSFVFII